MTKYIIKFTSPLLSNLNLGTCRHTQVTIYKTKLLFINQMDINIFCVLKMSL